MNLGRPPSVTLWARDRGVCRRTMEPWAGDVQMTMHRAPAASGASVQNLPLSPQLLVIQRVL